MVILFKAIKMEEDNKKQDKYLEKIDKQIESIETRINSLLEDIDIGELTVAERIDFSIKLQALLVKFIDLRRYSEKNIPEGREATLVTAWMRQLRGEADG
jgi:hypothetical protein